MWVVPGGAADGPGTGGRADVSQRLQPALSGTRTGPGLRGRWYRKSGTFQLSELV